MASSLIVYVWESRTGTVTITGTLTQEVDNIVGSNVSINHDRLTVVNMLRRLGYRLVGDTVHGVAAGDGWTVWTLEK